MATSEKRKIKAETILVIVGSLLLIISLILFHYEKILEIKDQIVNNIEAEKYKENTSFNNEVTVNIDVDYVDSNSDKPKQPTTEGSPNYIGFLEIDKINLRQGLLPKESYYNNVNFHVQILPLADYPDVIGGNFILAGHSGSGSIAYFRNLYQLSLGDEAKVYYKSKLYRYKIVNIYKQAKDGALNVYRDATVSTLTLITCTKNDKKSQTVYILELVGVESY